MPRIDELLDEYGESHKHPVNKLIHWICVPLIVWSLLGLIASINFPTALTSLPVPLDWAVVLVCIAMIYYLLVSRPLAAGIFVIFLLMLFSIYGIARTGLAVWKVSIVVFVIAWIGQFIGHSIEGKRPSFFKDLQFLLIGPLWLLSFVYRRLGIRY
jgi:uncharacterized membrane protein YGL010W